MAMMSVRRTLTLTRAILLRSSPQLQLLRSNPNTPLKKQISCFHTSVPRASSRHSLNQNQEDEAIGPDTILFEGCDYNHWLITMDFPKDPKPTPQQMVDTYVNTLAQVVGSVEEAKRRMYACSTTTYTGFQAVMTEEMSEKFKGLPGVVFILPDSYIDPVNKEYGGDKYDNGVITHRPPPYQYNQRYAAGGDRRPRNPQPPMQNDRQPPPQHYNQGPPPQHAAPNFNPRPDGRNHLPQQHNYSNPQNFPPNPPFQQNARTYHQPQHNYAPTLSDQRGPPPTRNNNYPPNTYPTQTNPIPPYQRGSSQVGGRDYNQPDNRDFRGEHRNIGSSYDANYRQGPGTGFSQMDHRDNMQGQQNFPPTRNDQQGGY